MSSFGVDQGTTVEDVTVTQARSSDGEAQMKKHVRRRSNDCDRAGI